jgi:glycosyltransferase involved in cell wall biosynthesis
MPRRHLFGPVSDAFAEQHLRRQRQAGLCLPIGAGGLAGTWDATLARLAPDWRPDLVVLDLHYTVVPPALWAAPVPVVGLAADWNLLWHHYRRCLRRCDLVLTDAAGVDALAREGIAHARPANLFGCGRDFLDGPTPDGPRDIDVLFIGNLNAAVQRERLPWLARLAALADRWRVVIRTHVYGDDYRRLLRRARVAFNRSVRGECNQRAFEAAACGALLFQEADNREVRAYFTDRREYVAYTADDLGPLLRHYLEHEDERRAIAEAARRRVERCSFESLWDDHLGLIDREWPALLQRAAARPAPDPADDLLGRTWQALSANERTDTALVPDLTTAVAARPTAALHNALGLAVTVMAPRPEWRTAAAAERATAHFGRAWSCDPGHLVAGLNLAEALALAGRRLPAAEQARCVLAELNRRREPDPLALDAGHFPPQFDHFRVEWERAAWSNAGRPDAEAQAKVVLLRWRLHLLLAELTGDSGHAYEAALARPDLPLGRLALGEALLRQGRHHDAVPHLRDAAAANPFDRDGARLLADALAAAGLDAERRDLIDGRRLLSRAAAELVPAEPWFAPLSEPGTAAPVADPQAARLPDDGRLAIVWEGAQLLLHSYAHVNREICRRLVERGHDLSVTPGGEATTAAIAIPAALTARFGQPLRRPADAHVRNHWPPDFVRPAQGRWVQWLFWEYGSLPRAWAGPLARDVDEVWVPSRFVRDCCVQSGIPADRLHVVPLGVDPALFRPGGPRRPLKTTKRFRFLFVGGTIARKGFDLLLRAYADCFTDRDDVCLVVKDLGAGSFYRGQTAGGLIAEHRRRPGAAEVEYIDRDLSGEELAGLYVACDCLVHPYRGEGFGLPVAEAMACGLPVIVTGYGAALDFCDQRTAYLLPTSTRPLARNLVGDLETVDVPWLAEPDPEALRQALRHVVANPDEAHVRGAAAAELIRTQFTWDHTADVVERRLRGLRNRTPGPPPETGLVSVIVVCRHGAEPTRLCLEGVLAHTRRPYELLAVDASGDDGTAAYLAGLGDRPEPVRVAVLRAGAERDPTEARGLALGHARGRLLAFLDGEAVVTEGWLARLVRCALHEWPDVGAAGPVTNAAAWPQAVPAGYAGPDELPAFAARRRDEYRGRATRVESLDPFCVVTRRDVIERAGVPGEGFCRRAREAGLRLLLATDVFVHRQTKPAGVSVPLARPAITGNRDTAPRGSRPRVSLCMIVRDEEANLAACLRSAADLADEVVIVDTGSTDRTRQVAASFGARVVEFPWVDDFAAARNVSIDHATGDWVFWLDADESLDEDNRTRLRTLFADLDDGPAAYLMTQLSPARDGAGAAVAVDHVRLFRRHPDVRWRYRVHEQILLSIRQAGHEVRRTAVVILHAGWLDEADGGRKLARNVRLLEMQDAEQPGDPVTLFNLGWAYVRLDRIEEALRLLGRSLELAPADFGARAKVHTLLARCHHRLGRRDEALAACRAGRGIAPDDPELCFLEGLFLTEGGRLAEAEACLRHLLSAEPGPRLLGVDPGLTGYRARHLLAQVYQAGGRHGDAEEQWRAAVAERPDFVPGWLSLAECWLGQSRWAEVEEAARRLEGTAAALDARVVRARAHLARREFAPAGRLLEGVIAAAPGAVWPRVLLSRVLVEDGQDVVAAERALREVLALVPDHAEAKQRLAALHREATQSEAADNTGESPVTLSRGPAT